MFSGLCTIKSKLFTLPRFGYPRVFFYFLSSSPFAGNMFSLLSAGTKWSDSFPRTLVLLQALLLPLINVCSSDSRKPVSEETILLQFKDSVADPHGILSTWVSGSDLCSWSGVSCDKESRVSSLRIAGHGRGEGNSDSPATHCSSPTGSFPFHGFGIRKGCGVNQDNVKLVGKLSPVFGRLTRLRVLSLPFNGFSGEIPSEIWGLRGLRVLDLEGNSFTGKLPHNFSGLSRLRLLNLGFNRLAGEIPFSLSECVGLWVLNLAGNALNGTIPWSLGSFPALRALYLSFNRLGGVVPDVFGNTLDCEHLEHVNLSENLLNGDIPGSFGNCSKLKTLLLFSNMLDGSIPRELGQLRQLQILDVSRNHLGGPIPHELGGCVSLSVLVLSNVVEMPHGRVLIGSHTEYNYFQGSIPVEITNLPMLRILWAPRAALEGKFPSSWGGCDSLEMVNLAHNHFTSDISGLLGGCEKLRYLNLSSNALSGKLQAGKPLPPCMVVLDVSGNELSGSIPSFINKSICPHGSTLYPRLRRFNAPPSFAYLSFFIQVTRLGTAFPFSGTSLAVIHNFGENNFSGPIPWLPIPQQGLIGRRTDYAFLAGGNQLNGPFPEHIFGHCSALNGLLVNISNNKISGQIPLGIGRMCRSLKLIDASENEISGPIPKSIGDMKSLLFLNLSGNKLQGRIPVSLSRLKNLKHLSVAGNNLTGTIPPCFGQFRSLKALEVPSKLLSSNIPHELVHLRSMNNRNNLMNTAGISRVLSAASGLEGVNNGSQNYATPPRGSISKNGKGEFNSIGIALIISASVIVSVVLALLFLFLYTRKWMPKSSVQVSEIKEITIFTDPGVPLTFDVIVQATGNFSASNCIGNGGFGATYRAEISPGILVAVKRLSVGRFVQGVLQFHAEIKTLERIRHPNLVTLIGYHASQTEMFLIYNYFPGGNLENFIQGRSTMAVSWEILHKIASDIAHALAYLHGQCAPRVLHRDVKPSNILLDNDFNAFLSDFGLSRLMGTSETHATTGVAGTFGYVAPEYATTCRVSGKADVYSYGVVLLELISDKKALDPSFSSHSNGFNIVSWAYMLLRHGEAKNVFAAGLWDAGPHEKLVGMLHVALMCTAESPSIRPAMKQVVHLLNLLENPSQ